MNKEITNYEISSDGSGALFGARGDVFTVPEKHGNTRNLTQTSGVHERSSKWSPDGKWVSFISDQTGEDEVYIIAQDGSGDRIQLTKNGDTYKYDPTWSPDGKKVLWSDKKQRLQYIDARQHVEHDDRRNDADGLPGRHAGYALDVSEPARAAASSGPTR